ncbi:MAG: SBBP repeat-containing protein [Bacteroidetes bacterium]|nr:SBBP repeat-containing protein [Bacteroidota bacterium]
MKHITFFILLVSGMILSPAIQVSAQAFQWAKNFGGTFSDEAYAVTVTNGNAIYVTGSFYDSGQFGPDNLVSAGDKNIYVARFDDSGNILWAVQAGGPADDRANDITADSLGNIYITGFFSQTATFGQYTITAVGDLDLFIARYSPLGVCEWVASVSLFRKEANVFVMDCCTAS